MSYDIIDNTKKIKELEESIKYYEGIMKENFPWPTHKEERYWCAANNAIIDLKKEIKKLYAKNTISAIKKRR